MTRAMVCGRLEEAPQGDYFVTCSFDKNHVLLRSRMPYHILKCIQQHPNHNKTMCPYDATEYIDPSEYENHILTCESRRDESRESFENFRLKAKGDMPSMKPAAFFFDNPFLDDDDEDWDVPQDPPSSSRHDCSDEPDTPVGRGVSFRPINRGIGRGEMFRLILERREAEKAKAAAAEGEHEATEKPGQFDDV